MLSVWPLCPSGCRVVSVTVMSVKLMCCQCGRYVRQVDVLSVWPLCPSG